MSASGTGESRYRLSDVPGVAVSIEAPGINTTWGAGGYCNKYSLAPGAQRACFTNTWPLNCSQDNTYAVEYLEMNGYSGSVSHREKTPC